MCDTDTNTGVFVDLPVRVGGVNVRCVQVHRHEHVCWRVGECVHAQL